MLDILCKFMKNAISRLLFRLMTYRILRLGQETMIHYFDPSLFHPTTLHINLNFQEISKSIQRYLYLLLVSYNYCTQLLQKQMAKNSLYVNLGIKST